MTLAIAIPHCPWDPDRKRNLDRIEQNLQDTHDDAIVAYKVFGDLGPLPPHVWFGHVCRWALETGAERLLQIQDDVVLPDQFLRARGLALGALEADDTVCHFTIAPWAKQLHTMGARFCSSTDLLNGPCWEVSLTRLREHIRWCAEDLRFGTVERLHEDELLGLSHAAHGWRIVTPLPTLADHDAAMASQYGHDKARIRTASLSWKDLPDPNLIRTRNYWKRGNPLPHPEKFGGDIAHFGCIAAHTPYLFARFIRPDSMPELAWAGRCDALFADRVRVTLPAEDGRSNPKD